MYSIHNEGKSVVAERFVRTLKTKINKYLTSVLKTTYIGKLDDIVNEYNNTYHRTKLSEEVFVIKKVRNTVPWTYVISDLTGEEIIGTFYEKELQKQISKDLG